MLQQTDVFAILIGRAFEHGHQVQECIGHVHRQYAVCLEVFEVNGKRLEREQMHGHRIPRESVHHQHVKLLRGLSLELQAAVAQNNLQFGGGVAQVSEFFLGQLDDQGVDFVQAVYIASAPIGHQGAHTQPQHTDMQGAFFAFGQHGQTHARGGGEVGGGEPAQIVAHILLTVDDLAVQHATVTAVFVHFERAIKVATFPCHALRFGLVVAHTGPHQRHGYGPAQHTHRNAPASRQTLRWTDQCREHHGSREHQPHRKFIVAVEEIRRDHADKKPTQEATHRQHQVVACQVAGVGLLQRQLSVARHAHHKKRQQIQPHAE